MQYYSNASKVKRKVFLTLIVLYKYVNDLTLLNRIQFTQWHVQITLNSEKYTN